MKKNIIVKATLKAKELELSKKEDKANSRLRQVKESYEASIANWTKEIEYLEGCLSEIRGAIKDIDNQGEGR